MATKLSIYNGALALLGETPISDLAEDRNARRWLDRAWDNGIVDFCLEQGQWNWATRTQQISTSTTIVPAFGPKYAFEMPLDFKGVNSIWTDPNFKAGLIEYNIEAGVLYCEFDTIYLKFISNAATYGGNLASWPESFAKYVQARLAMEAEPTVTNSITIAQKINIIESSSLKTAKNNDMRDKPRQRINPGNWVKSRIGGAFRGNGENNNNY
jgi:hypothetical protein